MEAALTIGSRSPAAEVLVPMPLAALPEALTRKRAPQPTIPMVEMALLNMDLGLAGLVPTVVPMVTAVVVRRLWVFRAQGARATMAVVLEAQGTTVEAPVVGIMPTTLTVAVAAVRRGTTPTLRTITSHRVGTLLVEIISRSRTAPIRIILHQVVMATEQR
jgi:hypothetical protein